MRVGGSMEQARVSQLLASGKGVFAVASAWQRHLAQHLSHLFHRSPDQTPGTLTAKGGYIPPSDRKCEGSAG